MTFCDVKAESILLDGTILYLMGVRNKYNATKTTAEDISSKDQKELVWSQRNKIDKNFVMNHSYQIYMA